MPDDNAIISPDEQELIEKLRLANELARQRMKEFQEKERQLESLTKAFQKAREAMAGVRGLSEPVSFILLKEL